MRKVVENIFWKTCTFLLKLGYYINNKRARKGLLRAAHFILDKSKSKKEDPRLGKIELPRNANGEVSNPTYIAGNPSANPFDLLKLWYSNSEIKRLIKQNGIKIARPTDDEELWIKVGYQYIIVRKNISLIALQAMVWWSYHFGFMPQELKWEVPEREKI